VRLVIQRVSRADVRIGDRLVGAIDRGLAILAGVHEDDTDADADALADKAFKLRIFADEAGKMNLAASDVGGRFLVVSQFTLYADTSRGRRPSFIHAAPAELGESLYRRFVDQLQRLGGEVETGEFGAEMVVRIENDGPVTIILESRAD